jgi:hypothetical protein
MNFDMLPGKTIYDLLQALLNRDMIRLNLPASIGSTIIRNSNPIPESFD